ncbi:MKI67 FHA domain-interacting nucleolar phosphoprotein isoform 1 [Schistosoma japonicum]|uniref:Hypotheticial protein n=1 Tax=Schistosoma japonicum TaxID=6182 RepID=C1LJ37_SCHJA|nr:hypothetical protein KSF78_0003700 [Schistosoma japonicum]TNN12057.1 MKI67 FHA domain-interacting nucleolar phosphoprotein isoform 1 [Schistosoma japonicum]CAX74715.1 hypotheticial protein [Schistosoma japonicum]
MATGLVVLRITRLPKYFGPAELRKYIEQFGKVHDLYMPKSKKTFKWKDNACVRMSSEVAPLVASTLNNLLQFNKIIKCEILPDNKRLFRTNRYLRSSTRALDEQSRIIATIKRVTALNARKKMNITNNLSRKSLPQAVRRRRYNLQKRLVAISKTNPNFKFQGKNQ